MCARTVAVDACDPGAVTSTARRVLAAPDKFRDSLSAPAVAEAIAAGARRAGRSACVLPLADGGEGTLGTFGGPNRWTVVTGPLGRPVAAGWRLADGLAVIESAQAAGLALAGGPGANDPLAATTRGVGELVAAALDAGAERIVVGVGGSATTDGGLGAVEALRSRLPLAVPVTVACDVNTRFREAADVFAPQKGATAEQVEELRERLAALADAYAAELGVDVDALPGSGAAGGLAGGLAALGASLAPGFELVAEAAGLDAAIRESDLVVTGEGRLDETSFSGKVVGGVLEHAARHGVEAVAVVGSVAPALAGRARTFSLVERFGDERARAEPVHCLTEIVFALLTSI
jgi:glycerate kinase